MSKVIEQLKNDTLMPLRHSAEHVLHTAMQELYPGLKKVMGPPIEDGFYFDFDLDEKISPDDFPKIKARMQEIIDANLEIKKHDTAFDKARELFKDNPYKLDTIDEIENRGEEISLYSMGEEGSEHYDIDLCSGPHVDSTGEIKAFELLSVAGAYYKGDENNKMLQRIYATAFDSQEKLADYLNNIEEAKKRDHKKLGKELELFMFHETAPGSPYWLPKGLIILNELTDFWRTEHAKRGYQETSTPLINKKALWETSGHWEHYKDNMFIADMGEGDVYGVKAMNCPNAMVIFGSKIRSYKDLPLRLSDFDVLHRYEKSGELNGLFRVRMFRQDDSHNYITEDQIESEYEEILEIADLFYGVFDLEYSLRLGTRPEGFLGDPKTWDNAEEALYKILNKKVGNGSYEVAEGDGAFYGPKIDIVMKDALGRSWQMGTIQLDFQQPARFNLKYVDKDGSEKTPVCVHRVIYGSIERFIGILIEHFGGAFPVWLSPMQIKVIPVSEDYNSYAEEIRQKFFDAGLRIEVDDRDETMQAKIRDAQLEKVPYMMIIGGREEKNTTVSIRLRTEEDLGAVPVDNALEKISELYLTRSLELW